MRRIYESNAVHRDDEDPHAPGERDDVRPQAFRSIDAGAWSRRLVPNRLRYRAISVDVSTPREEYAAGTRIPFAVTMKNAFPFPVTVATRSRILWQWDVDGAVEASRVDVHDPPEGSVGFEFDRGERKQFRKTWDGLFRVSDSEWEEAAPGEYTIGAGLNVDDAAGKGLYDATTVRILPE